MCKYLITGSSGFVSSYFLEYLDKKKSGCSVIGIDHRYPKEEGKYRNISVDYIKTDLLNTENVKKLLKEFKPEYVIHMASISSVSYSWQHPAKSFINNTNIFLNLLEVIRLNAIKCRILSIGSSEEYGNVNEGELPLSEGKRLNPISPYAVARVSQEMLSRIYHLGYGLDIVITRSFNHIGPRQSDTFVVSSFAKQLAEIKRSGKKSGVLICGDVEIIRDFLDVRDVVRAYDMLLKKGARGEVYNVCSGEGYRLKDIIKKIADIAEVHVEIKKNPELVRVLDNRMIIGDNGKLKEHTGWEKSIDIDHSLGDIFEYWLRVKDEG